MFHQHSIYCSHGLSPTGDDRPSTKTRNLWLALLLAVCFSSTELIVGIQSHSLALVADFGHMLSDSAALILALVAAQISALPTSPRATFGYRRIEILSALANGVALVTIAGWIAWEAIQHLQAGPSEIAGLPMFVTATVGLVVNTTNAFLLHRDSHFDLNLRGAFLHMIADAASSIGVILAALAVWFYHWFWADGVISLFVAGLILLGAIPLMVQSLNILLEKPPAHLDLAQVQATLEAQDEIIGVQDLKVWTVALGQEVLCAHLIVLTNDGRQRDRLLYQLQTLIRQEFGISEVLLQLTAPQMPTFTGNPLSDNLDRLLGVEPASDSGPGSSA